MSWNPQQQAMLSVMGYTLYRQAGAAVAVAAPVEAPPVPVQAPAGSDRLLQALVRAAGGRDLAALALPSMDQLRTDAAAKRALWPALRALRRKH